MIKVFTVLNEHKQKLGRPEYGISPNASTNVGRIAFDVCYQRTIKYLNRIANE